MQQQIRDHPDFDRWFLEYPEVNYIVPLFSQCPGAGGAVTFFRNWCIPVRINDKLIR
jgi:hypothetical protein